MKAISQREARRLKKQVRDLMNQIDTMRRSWGRDYPGVHLLTLNEEDVMGDTDVAVLKTARRMGHPVVVTVDGKAVYFYGMQ